MRQIFKDLLYKEMEINKDIYLLTGDLGYGIFDKIINDFSDRFYNVGSAEQLLIGAAVGIALENKIAICYSITSFLLKRPYEFIDNYLEYENIPVKLIGSGLNRDYQNLGYTHWSEKTEYILNGFPNIKQFYPKKEELNMNYFKNFLYNKSPSFMGLKR